MIRIYLLSILTAQLDIHTIHLDPGKFATMTATNTRTGDEVLESARSSIIRVDIESHEDLSAGPPVYTSSTTAGEETLDAEAVQAEKSAASSSRNGNDAPAVPQPQFDSVNSTHTESLHRAHTSPDISRQTSLPSDLPPDYFTELTNNAASVHIKRCSLLPERPATWLVKRKNMCLCPLSAAVLVKEGLVRQKDLELVSRSSGIKRDPSDPLSAAAFFTYDLVSDVMLGLIQGPVEIGRQAGLRANKATKEQANDNNNNNPYAQHTQTAPQEDSLFRPHTARSLSSPAASTTTTTPLDPRPSRETESQSIESKTSKSSRSAPEAAKQIAIGTGKGLGQIIGAALKAPMTFSHGMTRGFHNVPKLYGEEVHEYENVVDFRSGISVSAKGFGHGVYGGVADLFVKPVLGAQEDGLAGFAKGVGKGVGNIVCKPAAGMIGLVGYSSVGLYKEIQSINFGGRDDAVNVVVGLGEAELEQASDAARLDIVRTWCSVVMRSK
ncbi:unnamed protein product [Periconia digitata]|uniref:Uncharacterized protein n=1 Tax=Periconia digitata TaxID=1303443 RepID=A0A9W4UF05_9PLEO|nr:unnamed protein product [Periconia digitata]